MIGSLRGRVLERISDSTALLEVAGVGYVIHVTPRTLAELEPTTEAFLHVHHHVREDAQMLFGFLERDERRTFQVLIETNGIGPTLAMAILATHSPRALVDIVLGGDVAGLTMVPGVGKKTAERLVMELKDKVGLEGPGVVTPIAATAPAPSAASDAVAALVALGFKAPDADKGVRAALTKLGAGATADQLVKAALGR